jgi:hypothetical protein
LRQEYSDLKLESSSKNITVNNMNHKQQPIFEKMPEPTKKVDQIKHKVEVISNEVK